MDDFLTAYPCESEKRTLKTKRNDFETGKSK